MITSPLGGIEGIMNIRAFGKTGLRVSEIGLGAWQLGGDCWGAVSEQSAMDTLAAAVDGGVTFVDTADVYGTGRSETIIGRFLRQSPVKDLFVATKVGRYPDPGWPENFSFKVIRQHTENSLRRLGVDALDLTQLHSIPTEYYERGEVFDWLERLRDQGKIRRYGVSVESMHEANLCLRHDGVASLQMIFNLFRQKAIAQLFGQAQQRGVALIARLPLASGLLSGKFTKDWQFPADDHRCFNRDGQRFNVGETFAGIPFEKGVELADQIKPMVPAGMTMAQMALRWILDFDAISVVIPGARSPEQVRDNLAASDLAGLSTSLHTTFADFYNDRVAALIRGPY